MQVTVKITGDKELQRKLKRLGTNLHDMRRAFDEIAKDAIDYYQTRGFSSQGGVFGEQWDPLSAAYARSKAKVWPGRPPLIASGKMQDGFKAEAGKNYAFIENTVDYFKFHQSDAPRTIMPRRQVMGINEPIKRIVRHHIQNEVSRMIRTA